MAKKNSGLGRGLDAIFLDNSDIDQEETVEKVLEIIESNAKK